ncbi:fibrous sheath-interacting protein 1 [Perognathus longimembris pacificus]|uniref:fibrous sheath-interacting protein 1 n=1 Tax=Perognathus longimembris pacificus TaxID=214514 RepID=UPI0020186EC5|nr:fibrous sheath-interacting protein 1 [Perognathus longimembris pacificus]
MDIIKGNLDGISRPASNSRAHLGSRCPSASLEVLSPEPGSFKIDTASKPSPGKDNHSGNSTWEGGRPSTADKWADRSENVRVAGAGPSGEGGVAQHQTPPAGSDFAYDLKVKESDSQLQDAIYKMKRLDKILTKRQNRENKVKKQGVEMRIKLWEELKSAKNSEVLQSSEEMENTQKFLSLTVESEETVGPSHYEDEEHFFSVFHTQVPPEDYENRTQKVNQGFTCDVEKNAPLIKAENSSLSDTEKLEAWDRHNQDFIKRNAELAKNSRDPVVMSDRDKKRLEELLKDLDRDSGLSSSEGDPPGRLVPGEGYTLAPSQHQQLAEIDTKLQELSTASPRHESQNDQESALDDEKDMGITPGEKVLRDNKEQRDQQSRLKEIEEKLRKIQEYALDPTPLLSEQQLTCLLGECTSRREAIAKPPSGREDRGGKAAPAASPRPPQPALSESPNGSDAKVQSTEGGDAGTPDAHGGAHAGYYLTRALDGRRLAEALALEAESIECLPLSKDEVTNDTQDYFMSKTVGIGRLKRPSFLEDPLYDVTASLWLEEQRAALRPPEQATADEQQTKHVMEDCEDS